MERVGGAESKKVLSGCRAEPARRKDSLLWSEWGGAHELAIAILWDSARVVPFRFEISP